MTNRDDFLNLSLYGYKLSFGIEVTPLPLTPSHPGIKKTHKNEPNHLTNRDDFLNLSIYAYKLTSCLEVTPLPPTACPPGLKKTLKMNLTLIFSGTI